MCTDLCNKRNMIFKFLSIINTRVNVTILNVTVYVNLMLWRYATGDDQWLKQTHVV
jgi:hypothetical protein